MALSENERRALLNMGFAGQTGPYPLNDGNLDNVPDLRHLLGLYRFEFQIDLAAPPGFANDGDIFMKYDPVGGAHVFVRAGDLVQDEGLRTAVLISLLTDRRALTTDVLPDNTGELRGWWAEDWGSRLWLLFRSSLTPDIPSQVEFYSKESLQWMIEEGVASDIITNAEITEMNTVTWTIQIVKPGGQDSTNFKFFFNWEAEIFKEIQV